MYYKNWILDLIFFPQWPHKVLQLKKFHGPKKHFWIASNSQATSPGEKKKKGEKTPGAHWTGCDCIFNCHAHKAQRFPRRFRQNQTLSLSSERPPILIGAVKKKSALNTVIKAELAMLRGCLRQNIWVIAGIDAKS